MPTHLAAEFESFVRARTPALLRSAHVLTGDRHLAEDLVQNALARTYRAWPRLHETANAEAYARKIMYHLQVSTWRRRRIAETLTDTLPEQVNSAPDPQERATLQLALRDALLRLGPRQRAVLTLRFFEDLTEAETAEILGITVGTVKSQTSKALARLRVVAPELTDHYEAVAAEVKAVDLRERALTTARHLGVRRKVALSAAVLLVCAAAVGAALLARGGHSPQPTESPSPNPLPTIAPSSVALGTPVFDAEPRLTGFLGVPVTVPAWGDPAARQCPTGRIKLDGHAQYHAPSAKPGLMVVDSTDGDVDADGKPDRVAILRCGPTGSHGYQVVAFRMGSGDELHTIGQVIRTQQGIGSFDDLFVDDSGIVRVDVADRVDDHGPYYVQHQTRAYRWKDGRFMQYAGPTEFPAKPAAATLTISTTTLHFQRTNDGRYVGRLDVTVINSGEADLPHGQVRLHLPDGVHPAGEGWTGCTMWSTDDPYTEDPPITHISCRISTISAGTSAGLRWLLVADKPPASNRRSYATIGQTEPYTLQRGPDRTETDIAITVD